MARFSQALPVDEDLPNLHNLPHSVVELILRHLLDGDSSGSGTRAAVHLAFASKALLQAVAAADKLWQEQCMRLGWRLDWLATLPLDTTAWQYFCRRMGVRHRLRRQLRSLALFLDPLSAACLLPAAPLEEIREVEAALQCPLPWQLFELFRWRGGQARDRLGVQFLDAARLLSPREALMAAQERHGPLDTARAFQQLAPAAASSSAGAASSSSGGSGGAAGSRSADSGSSRAPEQQDAGLGSGGLSGGGITSAGLCSGKSCAQSTEQECVAQGAAPAVLLPFTEELRGRKRYCMDLSGGVWLASGFNTLPVAPSLSHLIRRVLT